MNDCYVEDANRALNFAKTKCVSSCYGDDSTTYISSDGKRCV